MEGTQMRTVYYQTSNFIRHTGNVVDLEEYRHRLELAQRDSLARQPDTVSVEEQEEPGFRPLVLTATREDHRRARRERQAWTLDACASLAVMLMTLVFVLWVIL